MRKKFTASHTTADRITGILLFVLPFSLHFADVSFSITAVCAMATFSVISQTYSIIKGNQTERL
jgi:CDP-diacylglycerol--glycerol-3-phosphate 3-phosphatidyltransferase